MTSFAVWLEKKYLEWQTQRGKRSNLREFSDALDIEQKTLANWMRGAHKPSPDYADKMSIFFGYDLTIYDVLEMPRPSKELLRLKALLPHMNDREKAEVGKLLDRIEQRNASDVQRKHAAASSQSSP